MSKQGSEYVLQHEISYIPNILKLNCIYVKSKTQV